MLVGKQDKETEFFKIFLERAINGERNYIDILTPIILEVAEYHKGKITIMQFDRVAISQKLKLIDMPALAFATKDNLMLKPILEYLTSKELEITL